MTEIPESIVQLEAAFHDNLLLEAELEKIVGRMESRLCKITGKQYERCGVRINVESPHTIVTEYEGRVERIAKDLLSVPGGPFETESLKRPSRDNIPPYNNDRADWLKAFAPLSPVNYWKHLAAMVNPEAQRQKASRDAAVMLGRLIGLISRGSWNGVSRNPDFVPPREVKGGIELGFSSIYVDDGYGECRVSIGAEAFETADSIQYALDAVMGDEAPPLGETMRRVLFRHERERFQSRERLEFEGQAYMIAFKKGYKLYLPKDIAGAINLFVSEQLADVLAEPDAA